MAITVPEIEFRFERETHRYLDLVTGYTYPHITGLLTRGGHVNEQWYTEEGSSRGTRVHQLTADYDLGALDVPSCIDAYRGYLLSHVRAMEIIPHAFDRIEEPYVHPTWRFGGRPDRTGLVENRVAVLEGKSGSEDDSHCIQTALQAILVAPLVGLPPEHIARYALYWQAKGLARLREHTRRRDFDEAYRLLRKYAGA